MSRLSRDPLTRLAQLREERDRIISLAIPETVEAARAQGEPWQHIGDALGISRAAAWERYRVLG
jgi:hypothetical protein